MRHPFPVTLMLLALAPAARAEAPQPAPANAFDVANAVDSATLDQARGGFVTPGGLMVSLGLERLVSINGNVLERTELQLGDIGKLVSGEGQLSNEAQGQLRLIQNGELRTVSGVGANLLGGTIIQNTLNDQLINSQTSINATVNTAGTLRALNFGTSLNNALSSALSAH